MPPTRRLYRSDKNGGGDDPEEGGRPNHWIDTEFV